MNPRSRERFDRLLDRVLAEMPPLVHQLIEKVPLHVEDFPSDEILEEKGCEYRDDLCGLFTGIPITLRSVEHSGTLPDVVTLYREGIVAAAADRQGRVTAESIREQMRITVLHELAHYHGLGEEELEALGYG